MNNLEVINEFLNRREGKTNLRNILNDYYYYKGRTLISNGNTLINYSTPIAYFDKHNILHINKEKYSTTTSKIQTQLRNSVKSNDNLIACEVTEDEIKELIKKEGE